MRVLEIARDLVASIIGSPEEGTIDDLGTRSFPAREGLGATIKPFVASGVDRTGSSVSISTPDLFRLSWRDGEISGSTIINAERRGALLRSFEMQVEAGGEVSTLPNLDTLEE